MALLSWLQSWGPRTSSQVVLRQLSASPSFISQQSAMGVDRRPGLDQKHWLQRRFSGRKKKYWILSRFKIDEICLRSLGLPGTIFYFWKLCSFSFVLRVLPLSHTFCWELVLQPTSPLSLLSSKQPLSRPSCFLTEEFHPSIVYWISPVTQPQPLWVLEMQKYSPQCLPWGCKLRKFIGCYIVLAVELLLFPIYLSCVISISVQYSPVFQGMWNMELSTSHITSFNPCEV